MFLILFIDIDSFFEIYFVKKRKREISLPEVIISLFINIK